MRRGILAIALLFSNTLLAQVVTPSPHSPNLQEQLGLAIPMRDGVRLVADVFLPPGTGRWPTLLLRTPYSRKGPGVRSYRFFAQRGYAVLIEDVRGRYASQGVFGPTQQQGPDANDTINWISEQAWSNGRVVMAGGSYVGIVQWWAAIEDNPHLFAISPAFSGDDEYVDRFYSTGGAFKIGHRLLWVAENFKPPGQPRPVFTSYIHHLPLRTADVAALGAPVPLWRTAVEHPAYDAYWKSCSIRERLDRVKLPVLSFGGWFDNYVESDFDAFSRLSSQRRPIEMWVGPWAHNPGLKFPTLDFGPAARIGIRLRQLDWFDRLAKRTSQPEGIEKPAPLLHIFVMGSNVWREEHEWPLARTQYTALFLNSKGNANSAAGDGMLQWRPVHEAQADSFIYDPKNPVPTIGGALCCNAKVLPPGPLNQTPVEGRRDILVYTSPLLKRDIEITGPVRVVLYVATSANDTDFTAKLVDVQADGSPLLVTDGIQRLRYRIAVTRSVFVKRNTDYQINIDAGVTSYLFAAGHRIRLEVSSSNFPRFDRNLNSTRPNAFETKIVTARQTVFHEQRHASAIILPIIPHRVSSLARR
ncbi:MAG: CocE/NonD family hydrolase [Bryobacteraceae bacterium]